MLSLYAIRNTGRLTLALHDDEHWHYSYVGKYFCSSPPGSPELAFVHSIQSAGITIAIARSCSQGRLTQLCGCDRTWTRGKPLNWTWGPCSDNYDKGYSLSKEFLDASERGRTTDSLMTLHNYEAGRQVCSDILIILILSLSTWLSAHEDSWAQGRCSVWR